MKRRFFDASMLNELFPSVDWTQSPYKEKVERLNTGQEKITELDDFDFADLRHIAKVLFYAALQLDRNLTALKNVSVQMGIALTSEQRKYLDTLYQVKNTTRPELKIVKP